MAFRTRAIAWWTEVKTFFTIAIVNPDKKGIRNKEVNFDFGVAKGKN